MEGRFDPLAYHPIRLATIELLKQANRNCLKLKNLTPFRKKIVSSLADGLRYVGLENIESDYGFYIPTNEKIEFGSALYFQKGQVLFSKLRPYLNKVYHTEFDGVCSTEFHVFDSKIISNEYLSLFLRSKLVLNQTQFLMSGNTHPRLQTDDVKNLLIPILSSTKQEIISNLWLKAKTERISKLQEANMLLKSIDSFLLSELGISLPIPKPNNIENRTFHVSYLETSNSRFDPFYHRRYYNELLKNLSNGKYPLMKLSNLCYPIRGVTYSKEDEVEVGLKILRANNITLETNELNFDDVINIRSDFDIKKNQKLTTDDILMSAASGSKEHVGKVAFVDNDIDYYFGSFMMVLRSYPNVYPLYLFEFLQSVIFRNNLQKVLGGTNINNLNFSMIRSFEVPVPKSINDQERIANSIKSIRSKIFQLRMEANQVFLRAKEEIEKIILGEI